jgi:SLT domain-containing protein
MGPEEDERFATTGEMRAVNQPLPESRGLMQSLPPYHLADSEFFRSPEKWTQASLSERMAAIFRYIKERYGLKEDPDG